MNPEAKEIKRLMNEQIEREMAQLDKQRYGEKCFMAGMLVGGLGAGLGVMLGRWLVG